MHIYLLFDRQFVIAPGVIVVVVLLTVIFDSTHMVLIQFIQHIGRQWNWLFLDGSSLSIYQLCKGKGDNLKWNFYSGWTIKLTYHRNTKNNNEQQRSHSDHNNRDRPLWNVGIWFDLLNDRWQLFRNNYK